MRNSRLLRILREFLLNKQVERWILARRRVSTHTRNHLDHPSANRDCQQILLSICKILETDQTLGLSTGLLDSVFQSYGITCTKEEFEAFHAQINLIIQRANAELESQLIVDTVGKICPWTKSEEENHYLSSFNSLRLNNSSGGSVPFALLAITARRRLLLDSVMGGMESRSRIQLNHALELPKVQNSQKAADDKLQRLRRMVGPTVVNKSMPTVKVTATVNTTEERVIKNRHHHKHKVLSFNSI